MLSCYGLVSLEICWLVGSYFMQLSTYVPMFRMTCILRLEECKIILQVKTAGTFKMSALFAKLQGVTSFHITLSRPLM